MKRNLLGRTGINVTELCFGALPLGPLQAKISVEEGANLIRTALEKGINFIDTAEVYNTYVYIKQALEGYGGEVVIASKSFAKSYKDMEKSIKDALAALNRNYLDIFHLHAARATRSVFRERAGALECLKDYKSKGIIRAIGISTHAVEVVLQAAKVAEIDVVFPIINQSGIGIIGGKVEDMIFAISEVKNAGKGIYAMKALAGGHLINNLKDSFNFVRNIKGINSIAVGMVSHSELEINISIFDDKEISQEISAHRMKSTKKLHISFFCKGCGTCIEICPNKALSLDNGKAVVDHELCLLCGYCNPVCPEFAIRLI